MIDKLLKLIGSIPHDKVLHFVGGLLIFALCDKFTHWGIAMGIVLVLSVIKEVYDKARGGNIDLLDIVAAMIGSATIFVINLIN